MVNIGSISSYRKMSGGLRLWFMVFRIEATGELGGR